MGVGLRHSVMCVQGSGVGLRLSGMYVQGSLSDGWPRVCAYGCGFAAILDVCQGSVFEGVGLRQSGLCVQGCGFAPFLACVFKGLRVWVCTNLGCMSKSLCRRVWVCANLGCVSKALCLRAWGFTPIRNVCPRVSV